MDWITGLQQAIQYMEQHLTEELDYSEIARQACSSSFHFQRVFGILCGYTLGEYLRNRRLTLAGSELAASDCKVIDVALKYGYDSPESFGRAFTRFHGITPTQARACRASLKSFSPLFIKLILEGGTIMDYRIEKTGALEVVVKKGHFTGGEVAMQQIPELWKQYWQDGTIPTLCRCIDPQTPFGNTLLGICFDSLDKADFAYAIGVAYKGGPIVPGLSLESLPACTWAVFPCVGKMPTTFHTLYKKIYTEFFPTSEYQPAGGMCIEVYPDKDVASDQYSCEVWISVEKK